MNSNLNIPLDPQQKILKNVKGLMVSRVIILTLLLAIAYIFQLSEKKYFFIPMTNQFYYFISLFYLVTIVYAFLLKRVKNLRRFTFIQLVIDHLFIAGLIAFTGGKESFFPLAYIFTIIGTSILFYKRGAFYSASLSTFLYGLILLLQLYEWIRLPGQFVTPEASQVFYSLITYLAAYYIVAFLSSTISEELKKKKGELIQKQVDYDQLEAFNRNIVQSLDSGLLTIDFNGRINFLNRTAEKILNRKGEGLKNVSIYDLFPEIAGVLGELKSKASGFPLDYKRYETLFSEEYGEKIYLGFSISPLTDPKGSVIGHTLIFQDITRFKEMEEQMKRYDRMAAIGALAAGMAHEIRNPLASLSGSIQMLKSELSLDPQQEHLMAITLRESERLNALITDFLLFAHPPQTYRSPWEIGKILDETVELFIHSPAFHDGLRITRTPKNGGVEALVDPDQIRQVFWNLLINAAQAIPDGGDIRIGIERTSETFVGGLPFGAAKREIEWVKIAITDSGNGISSQEKEKIFEPFYTTKEGGTGLGLSIVHKIIENHNGVIRVESDIGRGSVFTVFLPAGSTQVEPMKTG
ncbi:MAG: PAS domain-containing protein [Deltaproteobacteria bacterium]|nr:PAS domain-containing protein [Deltaproteobacteria bacterium]